MRSPEQETFGIIDIHSHILPGLDDGPRTIDESLRMCEMYIEEGVAAVVATPHMCDRRFHVTPEHVRQAAETLSQACSRRGLELKILPGADVRLEPELLDAVDNDGVLFLGDTGKYLLLELPFQTAPPIEDLVLQLRLRGITPILSHPERNMELWRKPHRLNELVEAGCLVQITAGSLFGDFGRASLQAAERFLGAALVDVVASDAHSPVARRPELARAARLLTHLAGSDAAHKLLEANPAAIVRGEPLAPQAAGMRDFTSANISVVSQTVGGSGNGDEKADVCKT